MNCHTESIFTGHSVFLLLRTIWFLHLRNNPAVKLMILVAAYICIGQGVTKNCLTLFVKVESLKLITRTQNKSTLKL